MWRESIEKDSRLPGEWQNESSTELHKSRISIDANSSGRPSSAPHHAAHRFDQLGRVVADPVFEHGFNVFNISDLLRRVALDHDQIRLFAGSDGADAVQFSEKLRAVCARNVNCLQRRESR